MRTMTAQVIGQPKGHTIVGKGPSGMAAWLDINRQAGEIFGPCRLVIEDANLKPDGSFIYDCSVIMESL